MTPAMSSGVATRPLPSLDAYRESLSRFVYHSGVIMQPLFTAAKAQPRRVVYAEGEDERVLRAAQIVVDEGLARPTLIGRPQVIEQRLERLGLRVRPGREFDLVNPESDPRYREYWSTYHQLSARKGVTPEYARVEMRRHSTLIGAMLMYKGEADGMLCGTFGMHAEHLRYIEQVIGMRAGVRSYAAMNALLPEYMRENLTYKHTEDGEVHPGEVVEEKISLSERFGLWISFYPFAQDDYLAAVAGWLAHFGVKPSPSAKDATVLARTSAKPRAIRPCSASSARRSSSGSRYHS